MKFDKFQKLLIYIITALSVLTIFMVIIRQTHILSNLDTKLFSFFSSVKYTLIDHPVQTIFGWVDDYATYHLIRDENDALRKDIDSLNLYKAQLMEANREIDKLKEILDLKLALSRYELINATVVGRDLSSYNDTIKINVGRADNIVENCAVITTAGLIGRVSVVDENSSIVKLITVEDGSNKVSVKIQISADTTAEAYLEAYDSSKKAFVLKLLSTNYTVTPGMTVVTSGMGGVFPSGLLVGTVSETQVLSNAVGMNVYVIPYADFSNIDYVSVVKLMENQQ
ncbi:MAG: rod shape-determining protein MreC [Erysipelotrichaceae bacterium]|nr:rod shape-determining protein MreC [Erysipelotrichaceae bacterium]MDD3924628.1 rod shape-determining protein MreC [Erysipelotrichaceae bacterium]MDD4643222.1 rod shape-determining protein MreC [Erysipelotrichaceae bacterium]